MKQTYIIFLALILVACSIKNNAIDSTSKDNISIITPYIEIKEKSNFSFIEHPDKRKILTEFVINTLKSEYPDADYIEIPFLFKDYSTINKAIEGRSNVRRPPSELLTDKYENSIFISINGYFGDINRGVMMLYVIDNKNKKWKMIERYVYDNSPLETDKTKKRILKSLEKLK